MTYVLNKSFEKTLFKMSPVKRNIAVKVFQRSIMICIFTAIKMSWMFS